MWNWRKTPTSPFLTDGRDVRKAPRYPCTQIACALGEVVDLSAQGVRVRCAGKPPLKIESKVELWLRSGRKKLTLEARVVRQQRIGRKETDFGLEFVNLTPAMAKVVEKLARLGFIPSGKGSSSDNANPDQPRTEHTRPTVRVGLNIPDHYGVLNIPSDATDEQVRSAFRQLATRHHPDVNKSPDAAERFMVMQRAYEVLRDAKKRREYDALIFGRSLPCG